MAGLSDQTDEQLFDQYMQHGDTDCFTVLVRRHQEDMIRYVKRNWLKGDHATSENVVQHTFVRLCEKGETWDPRKKLKPWLFSIAANHAINTLEAKKLRECLSLQVMAESRTIGYRGDNAGGSTYDMPDEKIQTSEENVLDQETIRVLRSLVATLPETDRKVIEFKYFQDKTCEEIAEILLLPIGSVKTCLHRALKSLKLALRRRDLDDLYDAA